MVSAAMANPFLHVLIMFYMIREDSFYTSGQLTKKNLVRGHLTVDESGHLAA